MFVLLGCCSASNCDCHEMDATAARTNRSGTTYSPQRSRGESSNNTHIAWTDQVTRMRAQSPVRKLSANDEPSLFRSTAQRPQLGFAGDTPVERHEKPGGTGRRFVGLPSPVTRSAGFFGAMDLDSGSSLTSNNPASILEHSEANRAFREAQTFSKTAVPSSRPPTIFTPFQCRP